MPLRGRPARARSGFAAGSTLLVPLLLLPARAYSADPTDIVDSATGLRYAPSRAPIPPFRLRDDRPARAAIPPLRLRDAGRARTEFPPLRPEPASEPPPAVPPLDDAAEARLAQGRAAAQRLWDLLAELDQIRHASHGEQVRPADRARFAQGQRALVKEMGRELAHSRSLVQDHPDLWRACAAAALDLGRPGEALRYFLVGFRESPADRLWLADWANALLQSGRAGAAVDLRKAALRRLWPVAIAAAHDKTGPWQRTILRSFAELLRQLFGPGRGAPWLRPVLAKATDPTDPALSREVRGLWRQTDPRQALAAFTGDRTARLRGPTGLSGLSISGAEPPRPALPLAHQKMSPAASQNGEDEDDANEEDEDDESLQPGGADLAADDTAEAEAANSSAEASATSEPGEPRDPRDQDDSADLEDDDAGPVGDLAAGRRYAVVAGSDVHGVGGLLLSSSQLRADRALGPLNLGLRAGYAYLHESRDLLSPTYTGLLPGEFDVAALGRWVHSRGKIEAVVGGNLRATDSLAYGTLAADYDVGFGLTLLAGLGVHQVVEDTSELRLLGMRDQATLGATFDLTRREFVNASANWHRYLDRQGELLSDGYSVYLEAGHRLLLDSPAWSVRVSGYWEQNLLVAALPAGLAAELVAPAQEPLSNLVVPQFAMVGAGTRFQRGLPGTAPSATDGRRWRFLVDLWAGYLWPLNQFGYDAQAGLGLSLPRAGELSVSGFLSNSRQGGGHEGTSFGAGLRYVY